MTLPPVIHLRSSAGLYGAEHVILALLPELAKLGVPSELLCLQNPYQPVQALWQRAQDRGLKTAMVGCRGRLDWATIRGLRARMHAQPRAIWHVHDYKSAFYVWLARTGLNLKVVSTSHGHFSDTLSVNLYNRLELALMKRFDHICAVSDAMLPALRAAGISQERLSVIANGIDTARFEPGVHPLDLAALGLKPDSTIFGAVMRMTPVKSPLGLVEAFATVRQHGMDVALLIAGDGPLTAAVEARVAELSLSDCVKLLGVRQDTERVHASLDAFVLSSLSEGLPLALLEAMATECPVIASAVGEVPEVLRGLDATLVPAGDVSALASALKMAAGLPKGRREAALRQRVIDRYSVGRMARDYITIYGSLAAPS
jgi:glycosyltransferase involved in cell wall biosynthesis